MLSELRNLADLRAIVDRCRITVTGGPHAGATITRDGGQVLVGSAANCDVVLFADRIAPNHFRVSLDRGLFGAIVVHAMQGPVEIDGGPRVEIGEYCEIKPGAQIEAGTATLRIERAVDPNNLAVPALRAGIVAMVLCIAWLSWSAIAALFSIVPAGASAIADSVNAPATRRIAEAIGLPVQGRDADLNAFVWRVRAELEERALNRGLRANPGAQNTIHVSGTISPDQAEAWNNFLRWYDTNAAFPRLVRDVTRSDDGGGLPDLRSIWLDASPTAYFADGSAARIGDRIAGDWVVTDIGASAVTVERDGTAVTINY